MFEMLFCFFSIFLRQGVWAKNTFSNVFFIINYLQGTWYYWITLKREWRRELLICLLKFLSNFLKANTWGHGGHCMLPINILLNILKKKPRGPKLMNYAATQKNWEAKTPPGKDRWDPFHTLIVIRQFCDCTPSFWLRKIKINTSIGSDSCRFNTRLVPSRFLLLEVCLYFETKKKKFLNAVSFEINIFLGDYLGWKNSAILRLGLTFAFIDRSATIFQEQRLRRKHSMVDYSKAATYVSETRKSSFKTNKL